MIELECSLAGKTTRLAHVWEHTVGCGHAPLVLRADLQAHLVKCRRDLGFGHVRFHGVLSAPMDAVICQNEEWIYSFFNTDQIIDFLLSIGMRPFVELSFMPAALASGSKTVFHYRANVTPPKDPAEWGRLIGRLVQHWLDRYGRDEVHRWLFESLERAEPRGIWLRTTGRLLCALSRDRAGDEAPRSRIEGWWTGDSGQCLDR